MDYKKYAAQCGCKNISYYFYTSELPINWRVRKCDCKFCLERKNHIYCSDPNGYVDYDIKNLNKLKTYGHGTNTADFLVCDVCNSYMGAVMKNEKGIYTVINLEYLIDQVRIPKIDKLNWQDEDIQSRLSRRHKTWTPVKKYNVS